MIRLLSICLVSAVIRSQVAGSIQAGPSGGETAPSYNQLPACLLSKYPLLNSSVDPSTLTCTCGFCNQRPAAVFPSVLVFPSPELQQGLRAHVPAPLYAPSPHPPPPQYSQPESPSSYIMSIPKKYTSQPPSLNTIQEPVYSPSQNTIYSVPPSPPTSVILSKRFQDPYYQSSSQNSIYSISPPTPKIFQGSYYQSPSQNSVYSISPPTPKTFQEPYYPSPSQNTIYSISSNTPNTCQESYYTPPSQPSIYTPPSTPAFPRPFYYSRKPLLASCPATVYFPATQALSFNQPTAYSPASTLRTNIPAPIDQPNPPIPVPNPNPLPTLQSPVPNISPIAITKSNAEVIPPPPTISPARTHDPLVTYTLRTSDSSDGLPGTSLEAESKDCSMPTPPLLV